MRFTTTGASSTTRPFMTHVDDVTTTGPTTSHWKVRAPLGRTVEWDAEIVRRQSRQELAWRSVEGADVDNEGRVTFVPAPGGRGTEVHVSLTTPSPEAKSARPWPNCRRAPRPAARRRPATVQAGDRDRRSCALRGAPDGMQARSEFPQHAAQPLTDEEYAEFSELAGRSGDEGQLLDLPQHRRGPRGPRPEDPERPRRHRQDHLDGDLWFGSPPRRRLRPDHAERRHPRPRVHGRGRRDRQGSRSRGTLRVGDRVVVPFPIACGACNACQAGLWSCCENSNPNAGLAEKIFGHPRAASSATRTSPAGTPAGRPSTPGSPSPTSARLKIESDLTDEQVLFLSDILPTGTWAPRCATSRPATSSLSGARDRSASSLPTAPSVSAPQGHRHRQ